LSLAEAGVEANALAESGNERDLARLRAAWADELEAAARSDDYRERAAAYRAVGQFRFRQKEEPCGAGWRTQPGLPRLGVIARAALARASTLGQLGQAAATQPGQRRRQRGRPAPAILRNGSPQRDTIVLPPGIAEEGISQNTADRGKGRRGLDKRANSLVTAAGAAAGPVAAGTGRSGGGASTRARLLIPAQDISGDAGDRAGKHRKVWIGATVDG
jgi:hypothetical protein